MLFKEYEKIILKKISKYEKLDNDSDRLDFVMENKEFQLALHDDEIHIEIDHADYVTDGVWHFEGEKGRIYTNDEIDELDGPMMTLWKKSRDETTKFDTTDGYSDLIVKLLNLLKIKYMQY